MTVVIDLMGNLGTVYCRMRLFERMVEFVLILGRADIARLIYAIISHHPSSDSYSGCACQVSREKSSYSDGSRIGLQFVKWIQAP